MLSFGIYLIKRCLIQTAAEITWGLEGTAKRDPYNSLLKDIRQEPWVRPWVRGMSKTHSLWVRALSKPSFTPNAPPRVVWRCFVDSEKMTFLENFDMYLVIFDIISQYFTIFVPICPLFVHYLLTICSLFAQYLVTIWPLVAHYLPTICSLFAHYLPTICPLFLTPMLKITSHH